MPAERLGEREFFARDVRTPATWEAVVAAAAGEFPDHLFAPGRAPTPPTNAERVEQGEVIDIAHLLAWLEEFVATRADDYV